MPEAELPRSTSRIVICVPDPSDISRERDTREILIREGPTIADVYIDVTGIRVSNSGGPPPPLPP